MATKNGQKEELTDKLKRLQEAERYLDEVGVLTIAKFDELSALLGIAKDRENCQAMKKALKDPDDEVYVRVELSIACTNAIRATEAEMERITEPAAPAYLPYFQEDLQPPRQPKKVPAVLYKYFPAARLVDVVAHRTLRFSQPSAVNDPFDVMPGIVFAVDSKTRTKMRASLASEEEQALELLQIPEGDPEGLRAFFMEDLDDEVDGNITMLNLFFKQEEERVRSLFDSNIGMLCLTERNDSILMWSHYADNHCGFAVGFSMDCSFFSSDSLAYNERPQPIIYTMKRPIFTPDNSPMENPMFVKSAEWSYENEWRLMRNLEDADRVVQSTPYPIHLFTIPQEAYHSIIFGCRAPSTLKETCEKLLAKDRKMKHVQLLEAFPSQDRFLLEVRNRGWKDNLDVHIL